MNSLYRTKDITSWNNKKTGIFTEFMLVLSMNSDSYKYFHKPVDGALKSVLKQHLELEMKRALTFLSRFLVALLQVRTVCLCDIATAFSGKAKPAWSRRFAAFFQIIRNGFHKQLSSDSAHNRVEMGACNGPNQLELEKSTSIFLLSAAAHME